MKPNELEQYVDYFLKIAIQKCDNLDEAQDLCQETMLVALKYMADGKEINEIKSWLGGVMNRKFYDSLRRKYKLPTVCIDNIEIAGEDEFDTIENADESEELRRHIAFLTRIYREVIVRHYLNGESIEIISNALKIPQGTVKSRLSSGRSHIKKGFDNMENYTKHSYEPQVLHVGISGELMKRIGNKIYTDFIIYSHDDAEKNIEPQKKLINDNFSVFWNPLQTGLNKLRSATFYTELSERKRQKLEYYFLMHTMSECFFGAGVKIYDGRHDYPERPNGGKWVAMGHSYPQNYDYNNSEIYKYIWSGERTNEVYNTLGVKKLMLKVFDTPLEKQRYFHTKSVLKDDVLAQVLYIINEGITPSDTGVDTLYFENIPYLAECGVLHIENGRPTVDIPILIKDEHSELSKITGSVKDEFIPSVLPLFSGYLKNVKMKLPPHLYSVTKRFSTHICVFNRTPKLIYVNF